MRNIRLKPLYLPNDDILVQPPSFLHESEVVTKDSSTKVYLSNLDDLKSMLRGRRLKSLTNNKRKLTNDEQESVLKLSEFKVPNKARSPLSRKYTFRRSYSNLNQESAKNSPVKIEENQGFMLALQTIVSKEKGKNKETEYDMQRFTESNIDYEAGIITRMKRLTQDIEDSSDNLTKLKIKIKLAQADRDKEAKLYDDNMTAIMNKETSLTLSLHSVKGKKKHHDVNEERDYFIVKEALRKSKRELHAAHIEAIEKAGVELENLNAILNQYQAHKRNSQKEFKDLQETLINFYCMNLKEGMDLREDGIRWTIKSLWKMKQAVPVSAFPRYLDDESGHFLLFVSEKDLEKEFFQKRLNELREEIKKDHMGSSLAKSPRELFGLVQERLKEIKKKSRAVSLNSSAIIESYLKDGEDLGTYRYDEIKSLKEKLKNDEKIVSSLTMEEIKRVVNNYNPETTKNVGITHIIKALAGDKSKDFRRLARQKMENNNKP